MRTELLQLRVRPDDKRGFQEAVALAGIPFFAWVRERLRTAAIRQLEGSGRHVPFAVFAPLRTLANG